MIDIEAIYAKLVNRRKYESKTNRSVKFAIIKVNGVSFVGREYGFYAGKKIHQEIVGELKRNPYVKSYLCLKRNAYIVLVKSHIESHSIELVSRLRQNIFNRIGTEFNNIIWINTCLMEKTAQNHDYKQTKELVPQKLLTNIFCVLEKGYNKTYRLDTADYPYNNLKFEEII